jgi:3-oxoacyl-ACP reductase-like protein
MNRLQNKNIYYIITGAKKAELSKDIINEMVFEGAKVFIIPTKASEDFIDLNELKNTNNCTIKTGWSD